MRPAGLESLPMGYIRLDFLESTGVARVDLLKLNEPYDTETIGFYAESTFTKTEQNGYPIGIWGFNGGKGTWFMQGVGKSRNYDDSISGQYFLKAAYLGIIPIGNRVIGGINFLGDKFHWAKGGGKDFKLSLKSYDTLNLTSGVYAYGMLGVPYILHHRIKISQGNVMTRDFIPTLDPTGTPCVFDLVTRKPFYNTEKGSFIAGLTMGQALNLANLPVPTTSNTLTISLPKEATLVQYNQEVNAAIAAAEGKGWSITVKYRDKFDDESILNKYAECETLLDVSEVNSDWDNDITSDGEWIYPLTNAVSLYDLQNFGYRGMFTNSEATKIYVDAPKLTDARYLISSNPNVKYAYLNMPSIITALYIVINNAVIEEIEGYMPKLTTANFTHRYYSQCKLRSVKMDFPKLSVAKEFLPGAILDKESTLRILNSIPSWTSGTHELTIGIHVDNKYDPEVNEALKRADLNYEPLNLPIDEATGDYVEITEGKGWTLTVQWNGTATENAYPNPAATYSLSSQESPVFAKLVTSERPDRTVEDYLDWGHYVTNWEENGYTEFASLEEAHEHFNLEMPAED